jgi:hypothetical protein
MRALAFDLLGLAKASLAVSCLVLPVEVYGPNWVAPYAILIGVGSLGAAVAFVVASKKAEGRT